MTRPRRTHGLLAALALLAACDPTERPRRDGGDEEPDDGFVEIADDGAVVRRDLAAAAPTSTTAVTVHVQPSAGLSPLTGAIRGAAKSVDFVCYYLASTSSVTEALIAARKAGRQVRVILEQSPDQISNAEARSKLLGAGVSVQWGRSGFPFTHAKYFIVDGKSLWATTMNFPKSVDNREYVIVDTDARDVAEAKAVFDADWSGQGSPTVQRLVVAPANARARLNQLIDGATESIDVEWESLSDNDIGYRLQRKAKAGIPVRVIAPTETGMTTLQLLGQIKLGGVDVRLLAKPYMHAKMILVDGKRGFIGSINGTTNSIDRNRELGVIWENATVAKKVGDTFESDYDDASPM